MHFPRYALRQPVTFIAASSFPASPRVRFPSEGQASLIFLFASPSLIVIRLAADTPTQMISRHFLPTVVLRLPIFPPSRDNLPSVICSLTTLNFTSSCSGTFILLPSLVHLCIYYFFIGTLHKTHYYVFSAVRKMQDDYTVYLACARVLKRRLIMNSFFPEDNNTLAVDSTLKICLSRVLC